MVDETRYSDIRVLVRSDRETRVVTVVPPGHQEVHLWDSQSARYLRVVVHPHNIRLDNRDWCLDTVAAFLAAEKVHRQEVAHALWVGDGSC